MYIKKGRTPWTRGGLGAVAAVEVPCPAASRDMTRGTDGSTSILERGGTEGAQVGVRVFPPILYLCWRSVLAVFGPFAASPRATAKPGRSHDPWLRPGRVYRYFQK